MIFAFLAGLLSTLSPCVLPLLPVVFGAAVSEHKLAPLSLAAGIALSFTSVGLFVALVGFSVGQDTGLIRFVAALLMMMVGIVLTVPQMERRPRSRSWLCRRSAISGPQSSGNRSWAHSTLSRGSNEMFAGLNESRTLTKCDTELFEVLQ